MTTCQPVPALSGNGSITGASSGSAMPGNMHFARVWSTALLTEGVIAEAAVSEKSEVRVERVTIAVDCGHVVQPARAVEMQVDCGTIHGPTAALYDEITIRD